MINIWFWKVHLQVSKKGSQKVDNNFILSVCHYQYIYIHLYTISPNSDDIFFHFTQIFSQGFIENNLNLKPCSDTATGTSGGKSADETLPRPGHVRNLNRLGRCDGSLRYWISKWYQWKVIRRHHGHQGLKVRSCNVWWICLASLVHGVVNWFRFVKNTEPVDSSAGQRFEWNINFPTVEVTLPCTQIQL